MSKYRVAPQNKKPMNLPEASQSWPKRLPLTQNDILPPPLNTFNPATTPQWWVWHHIIELYHWKGILSQLYLYYKPVKLHQKFKMNERFYGHIPIIQLQRKTVDNGTYITDTNICKKYKTKASRWIYNPEVHRPCLYGHDMTSYRLFW